MSVPSLAAAGFWARPGLVDLLGVLDADGEEARVVGGAVRNSLLGLPVTDVDIATTALPEVVTARVAAAGMKAVPTGIDHGTVTVVVDHQAYEVTTLREDTETDGRRAVVRFGRSWTHDAARRDFTINALYATRAGTVIDLVGGLADITARRVRFIGDAEARIREDYLRILRLFRFHAAYGLGDVDPAALLAAVRLRAGLLSLSHERVRAEMLKLLMAERAVATLQVMSDAGLLQPLLAGVADLVALRRLTVLEGEWQVPADPIRRLAALALRVKDDAARLREHLRLSNAETRRLEALSGPVPELSGPRDARAAIYRLGAEAARDRVLLVAAHGLSRGMGEETLKGLQDFALLSASWVPPRMPVTAADLMARGLKPGPALGAALARAESAWIKADFATAPDQVEAILTRALSGARAPKEPDGG